MTAVSYDHRGDNITLSYHTGDDVPLPYLRGDRITLLCKTRVMIYNYLITRVIM